MTKPRSLLFNASITGLAQAGGRLIRFVIASIALSRFGAVAWGEVAYALTLSTYVNFVLDFGISSLALIDKPDDPCKDRRLFIALSYMRLLIAIPVGALAIFLLSNMDLEGGLVLKLYLLVSLSRPISLDWWLQRKGFTGIMPSVQLIKQACVLLFLFFCEPKSIATLVIVDVSLEFLAVGCTWILGPKRQFSIGPPQTDEWEGGFACYRSSLVLFVSSSLLLLHQNVDIFFIRYFHGLKAVGLYDYSYRFVQFAFFAGASLSIPLRRQLARLKEQGEWVRQMALIGAAHKVLGILSLLFLIFALYISPFIFSWTQSAPEIWLASQTLVILACWLVLSFGSIPLSEWLINESKNRYLKLALLAGISNVVANVVLVPMWGIRGGAIAKVVSEFVILLYLIWLSNQSMRKSLVAAVIPHFVMLPAIIYALTGTAVPWWAIWAEGFILVCILLRVRYISADHWAILKRE